jgi:beta-N-acetylhexosaminidase
MKGLRKQIPLAILLLSSFYQSAEASNLSGEEKMHTNVLSKQHVSQSIADKIIIGFQGTSADDQGVQQVCQNLKAGLVGGVILFSYNIVSPQQTKQLITDLKEAAGRDIWIAVDQEGGKVQRLNSKNGFTDYLSPLTVATTMTPYQAYEHYRRMAGELADLGFNLNFGCVLDLHARPGEKDAACPIIGGKERSYGSEPSIVAAYAMAFVRAHRHCGVTACLKHYPGHGLAKFDSHAGLVDITDTHLDVEREPFRLLIRAEMADMIMTAHLVDRKSDAEHPISLSQSVLHKWLRDEDGYKGLIITDDLHMGAIGDHYTMERAIVRALKASSDIIIISNNKNAAPNAENFEVVTDLKALYEKVDAEEARVE